MSIQETLQIYRISCGRRVALACNNRHAQVRRIIITVLSLTLLCASRQSSAACTETTYRIARTWENSALTVMVSLSIGVQDLAPDRLACLAQALRRRYASRQNITALIFSSHDAARYYNGDIQIGDSDARQDTIGYARQLHALYKYDGIHHDEFVLLKPLGFGTPLPEDTKITLPVSARPRCRLAIGARCLLITDEVVYPLDALEGMGSGTITLTAVVDRMGVTKEVRVVSAKTSPPSARDLLANGAISNLKSWRLEAASREDPIRVDYRDVLDKSTPAGQTQIEFDLPNRITIRASGARPRR